MPISKEQKKKDRAADLRLRRAYNGYTLADYNKQLKKQNGACWICGRFPKKLRLAVDHNHATKKNRGLLCMICNRKVLGVIERFKIVPQKIVDYLKHFDSDNPLVKGDNEAVR
jgi:hypothetical protein